MKPRFLFTALLLVLFFLPQRVAQAQTFQEFDQQYEYYYQTLSSRAAAYYKFWVSANTIGVFTLKNLSQRSDFDIYVYSGSSMNYLIAGGEGSGTRMELEVAPATDRGRYVYIKILNRGSYSSEYRLYGHTVDPAEKLGIALLEVAIIELFSGGSDDSSDEAVSRGVTGLSSILQGNDLGGVSRDLLINEVRMAFRKEFGYGALADVVIGTIVYIIVDVYKYA